MNKVAVWFSCGAASAVAAKMTILLSGGSGVRVLNTPVPEEDADNQRFREDVSGWLGIPIETVVNKNPRKRSCDDVWQNHYMSTPTGAPCTKFIKKEARQQWEVDNPGYEHVLGFTYDEKDRHDKFVLTERNILPVLIAAKITKQDCFDIVRRAGIELPRMYRLGYPNANCVGCSKATSPTYWNHVRKHHPEVFAKRIEQSERYGAKLVRVKNERIPLKDLDPLAKGRPMKGMEFECGVFCEER